jgi:hypothetical protein
MKMSKKQLKEVIRVKGWEDLVVDLMKWKKADGFNEESAVDYTTNVMVRVMVSEMVLELEDINKHYLYTAISEIYEDYKRLQLIELIELPGIPTTAVQIVKDKIKQGYTEKTAIKHTVEFLQRTVVEYNIDPNKSSKRELIDIVTKYYEEDKRKRKG